MGRGVREGRNGRRKKGGRKNGRMEKKDGRMEKKDGEEGESTSRGQTAVPRKAEEAQSIRKEGRQWGGERKRGKDDTIGMDSHGVTR